MMNWKINPPTPCLWQAPASTQKQSRGVFVATSGTDCCKWPALIALARRCALDAPRGDAERLRFTLFALAFTHATSFLYHAAQALCVERVACRLLGLSEGAWHFLDNIGATAVTCAVAAHSAELRSPNALAALEFCCLAVTLVLHMRAPWAAVTVAAPVGLAVAVSLGAHGLRWRQRRLRQPRGPGSGGAHASWCGSDPRALALALASGTASLVCFARGLDDDGDFLRLWHGGWHMLNGVSLFFTFRVLPPGPPPGPPPSQTPPDPSPSMERQQPPQARSFPPHDLVVADAAGSPSHPDGATKGDPPPPAVVVASAATTGAGSASAAAVIIANADPGHDPGGGAVRPLSAAGAHRSKCATGGQRGTRKRAASLRPGGGEDAVDEAPAAAPRRRSHDGGGGVKQRRRASATSTSSSRTGR